MYTAARSRWSLTTTNHSKIIWNRSYKIKTIKTTPQPVILSAQQLHVTSFYNKKQTTEIITFTGTWSSSFHFFRISTAYGQTNCIETYEWSSPAHKPSTTIRSWEQWMNGSIPSLLMFTCDESIANAEQQQQSQYDHSLWVEFELPDVVHDVACCPYLRWYSASCCWYCW